MSRTGSLWPYRILAAPVWHLRAARVPLCHVAAHEQSGAGLSASRPTNPFAIKGAMVPFCPPYFHSRILQVPVVQRLELFEPSAPLSVVELELSGEPQREHAAELACPSSFRSRGAVFFLDTGTRHGSLGCFFARHRRSPRQAPANPWALQPRGSPPPLFG
jgi:hypothetical protein